MLATLAVLTDCLNDAALIDIAPTAVAHNARARMLRQGLAVLVFSTVETFIRERTGEVLHLAAKLMPATTRVAVPDTAPGDKVQISVRFTAPGTPGTLLSYWKMAFADGSFCFPPARGVWVKVRVSNLARAAMGASVSTGP